MGRRAEGFAEPTPLDTSPCGSVANYRAWCLWNALRAESAASAALQCQLEEIHASRSWRITAPLRRLARRLSGAANDTPSHPSLQAETQGAATTPRAADIRRGAPWLQWLPGEVSPSARQLLVDVTELALQDLGGGIQRVVGRVLAELVFAPPAGHVVVPVRLSSEGSYLHARRFFARFLGLREGALGDDVAVVAGPGDHFLGLDLVRDHADAGARAMEALRGAGVETSVVVYDLLPTQHPEWFPDEVPGRFQEWVDRVARRADRLLCISGTVLRDCERLLADIPPDMRPDLASFPLGADACAWMPQIPVLPPARDVTRFLMVGTIEPRKGHAQAIAAFEQLWAQGRNVELVIAGHEGWQVAGLVSTLQSHPELARRLHWIRSPGDAVLASLYGECDCLLMATHGEGFGLPVVEALYAGRPLLLRDLPVFREVAGEVAGYFSGDRPEDLAEAVLASLPALAERAGRMPPGGIAGWSHSAHALKTACGLVVDEDQGTGP